jgi:hypothetical protein
LLLSNANALFNLDNYNSVPKLKTKEGGKKGNAAAKSSKENAFKEIFFKKSLSLKESFNN